MSDQGTTQERSDEEAILGLLEAELVAVRAQKEKSKRMVILVVALVGAYLGWAGVQINKLLDPEGVAQAATGFAIEAVPTAGDNLRSVVVDGAPDLARAGTQALLDLIPAYREVLEEELTPVVDEVSTVLAQAVVHSLVNTADKAKSDRATQRALESGADAVVKRLDTVLEEAFDQPTEVDGPTPRQTIEIALGKLERIDAGLKRIAAGKGDPKERELILGWIGLLQQFDAEAETAAIQAYKQGHRVAD